MPALGSSVLLPDAANLQAGFQANIVIAAPGAGNPGVYQTTSLFYEVLQTLLFAFTADATVGTRSIVLTLSDQNGATVYDVQAPTGIGPGGISACTFAVGVSTGSTGGAIVFQTIQIPELALFPGWKLTWQTANTAGPGDPFAANYITTQRFISNATTLVQTSAPLSTPLAM
jgi:hypothetical protein